MTAARDRIAGFDGLRAIAFMLVFVSHKFPIAHRDPYGDVGVWTFFTLSGFLITRILASSREEVEAGRLPARWALARFYLRRTARIFPIYYTVLAIALLASAVVPVDYFWGQLKLAYLLYATNLYVGAHNMWVGDFGHLWSLAVEEQFYLLFAPLALLTPRRWTWALCLGFVTIALAVKVGLEQAGAPPISIDVNSLINFGLLGLGGLSGLAAGRPGPAWLASGWAQAASGLCLLALPVLCGGSDAWPTYAKASGLIAALLLFQVARGQDTWVVALLQSAPFRLLGRVSYGAYLFHHFIHFQTLQAMLAPFGASWTPPQSIQILTEFVITIVLSAISWVVLERPILGWAAKITRRKPFSPAGPSGAMARPEAASAGLTGDAS